MCSYVVCEPLHSWSSGFVCVFLHQCKIFVRVYARCSADSPAGLSGGGLAADEVAVQTDWGLSCSLVHKKLAGLTSYSLSLLQKEPWWTHENRAERSDHPRGREPWDRGVLQAEDTQLVMLQ